MSYSKPTLRLIDRLRGIYILPVNDGAGLLNGSDVFERPETFPTPPIQKEAAAAIEAMAEVLSAYAAWEADILVNDEGWDEEPLPRFTQGQWDRLVELQTMRNDALEKTKGSGA